MATIVDRGNGSWRIMVSNGRDHTGKQVRITRTVHVNPKWSEKKQRAEVLKEAQRLEVDADRMQISDAKKLSFAAVYEDYIKDRIQRRNLTKRTEDSYRKLFDLQLLPAFGNIAIRDISPRDVNKFLQKLANTKTKTGTTLSGTYQLKYYQQLHELFVYAQRSGLIVINPCDFVEPPKRDTKEAQYYDKEECIHIAKLINEQDDPMWKAFFSLSFYCGARPGEIIGLNWSDYDGTNIFIQAGSYKGKGMKTTRTDKPKTKRSIRKIQLPPEAITALSGWRKAQAEYRLKFRGLWPEPDTMFTGEEGQRVTLTYPARKWKEFTEANGIRHLPLYDLRHTHCSILIASRELSIEEVAARMGHEQTSTTLNIYTHAFADSNERATKAFSNFLSEKTGM